MKPTRIFVDGYNLTLEQGTGVATYARNLSKALRAMKHEVGILYGRRAGASKDMLAREVGFFDPRTKRSAKWLEDLRSYRRLIGHPFGHKAWRVPVTGAVITQGLPISEEIWNLRDLFSLAETSFGFSSHRLDVTFPENPPDIMHWTYPVPVRAKGAKNIYTMHDLVPLRLPSTTLDNKRRYLRLSRELAATADLIVTVSECSKRDIVDLLGISEDKVVNTYQSVEIPEYFRTMSDDEVSGNISGSFGLTSKGYYLFFGAIEPKKNVGRLIEAYLASGVTAPLVIVGKKAWKSEGELRLMFDDNIKYLVSDGPHTFTKHRIMLLDYAPFSLLMSLVKGAKAVLFPSLYEGFGLPVLEAMHLGTPVMTSSASSLPELVGTAALTVDPYEVRDMVEAIRSLDTDAELRARLAMEGPIRAELFSPERYQARLAAMYGKLGVVGAQA